MKEITKATEYAQKITEALPKDNFIDHCDRDE